MPHGASPDRDRGPPGPTGKAAAAMDRGLRPIGIVVAGTALAFAAFELLDEPLLPGLSRWQRDLVEIALVASLCAAALMAVFRAQHVLRRSRERLMRLADQRQHTSEALQESLDHTQALLDAAADGILTLDAEGTVVSGNRAARELFGYAEEELVGLPIDALVPESRRRGGAQAAETPPLAPARLETLGRREDGGTFPLDLTIVEVRTGNLHLLLATVHDLTGRRRTEEDLRQERDFAEGLLETAPVIVLVLDPNGRIVRFNRCMDDLSGYTLEEVRDEDWFTTFLPQGDRVEARRMLERARQGLPAQGYASPIVTKTGQQREVEWYGTALRNAQGEVTGVLAVGRDITEHSRLENQLRHAQKMEAVGRLAGGVAHDFNTILLTIGGRSEQLLAHPKTPSSAHHQLREITKAVDRATNLTRQLLAFSRQEAGELRPQDLNRVVLELEDMVRRLIGEDVTVVARLAEDLWPILADRGQVEQVLLNLVVNARDAMPQGGSLVIKTTNTEAVAPGSTSPVACVLMKVKDTGHGMDGETLKRAFEPFFTTKEVGTGTGLGLSTVYGIVTQCGGDIRLESVPGHGTTVLVYWPRAKTKPDARATAEPRETKRPESSSGTILLVEDDDSARELLKDFLEEQGFRVHEAADGNQALGVFEDQGGSIDLLITDWRMPRLSGTELAERVRAQSPETAILYISGWTSQQMPVDELQRKRVRFLHKPFSLRDLGAAARTLLQEGQE